MQARDRRGQRDTERDRRERGVGLLERRQYQECPARFEYHLTETGRALLPVLLTLMDWSDRHLADGESPLTNRYRCGADFKPVLVCHTWGSPSPAAT